MTSQNQENIAGCFSDDLKNYSITKEECNLLFKAWVDNYQECKDYAINPTLFSHTKEGSFYYSGLIHPEEIARLIENKECIESFAKENKKECNLDQILKMNRVDEVSYCKMDETVASTLIKDFSEMSSIKTFEVELSRQLSNKLKQLTQAYGSGFGN